MKQKKLKVIHANVGIEVQFRKQLESLIDEMHRSLDYWLTAAYRANTPATMAKDASNAATLQQIMSRLTRKWLRKFKEVSQPMGDYYAKAAKKSTDYSLKQAMKDAGIAIEFKVTPAVQDIITSSVNKNVQSIKSIASEHLESVNQLVMSSVQSGGDLGGLRRELEKHYGITKNRAALIARTSNRQTSAMIERARAKQLGIEQATWVHSSAGRHPRREHLDWNGKLYNVDTGKWSSVSNKYVWPGSDYNCRCSSRLTIPTSHIVGEKEYSRSE